MTRAAGGHGHRPFADPSVCRVMEPYLIFVGLFEEVVAALHRSISHEAPVHNPEACTTCHGRAKGGRGRRFGGTLDRAAGGRVHSSAAPARSRPATRPSTCCGLPRSAATWGLGSRPRRAGGRGEYPCPYGGPDKARAGRAGKAAGDVVGGKRSLKSPTLCLRVPRAELAAAHTA